MTSWCPSCDDQQADVPWSYYTCIKCGEVVCVSSVENKIVAKARMKAAMEYMNIQRVCQNTIPNIDMLS